MMIHKLKKETAISALLVIGTFYFSFMILDRVLSIIYGFNFQPFGSNMPPGFTFWGHIADGSLAAFGLFLTFKLYDYGKEKNNKFLEILPFIIAFTIMLVIPYINDSAHLEKNGMEYTLPIYVIGNALYVFFWGLLMFKIAKPIRKKVIIFITIIVLFLFIHFYLYNPMFPEFYWS